MNIYVCYITHSKWQLKKAKSENTYKLKAWYVPPQPPPKPWAILHTLLLGDHRPALKQGSESTPQPILAVKTFTLQMECSKVKIVSNPEPISLGKFRHGNIYTNTGMRGPVPSPQAPSQAPSRAAAGEGRAYKDARSHARSTRPPCSGPGSGLQTCIFTCSHASVVGSEAEGQRSQNRSKN